MGKNFSWHKFTDEQKEQMIQMYRDGLTQYQIAKEFGVSRSTIERIVQKSDVIRKTYPLTEERKKEICELYLSGKTIEEICEILHTSSNTISKAFKDNNVKVRQQTYLQRKYEINEDYFEDIDTPAKAYFLGLLAADGCCPFKTNAVIISLQSKDKHILESLKYELGSNHPLQFTERSKKNSNWQDYYTLYISNQKMHSDLIKHGIVPNKSYYLEYPMWLRNDLHKYYILGYLDGDGCIAKNGRHVYFTSTKEFCVGLQRIITDKLNISSKLYDANSKNGMTYYLRIQRTNCTRKLLNWLYQDPPYCLFRKYDVYKQYYADKPVI